MICYPAGIAEKSASLCGFKQFYTVKIDFKKSAVPVIVNWLISLLVLYVSSLFGGGMG